MRVKLFVSEGGIALLDEKGNVVASEKFDDVEKYDKLMLSIETDELKRLLERGKKEGVDEIVNGWPELQSLLEDRGFKVIFSPEERERLEGSKLELMVKTGLVKSEEEAFELIRKYAIYESEKKIKEKAAQPDLQVVQAVQSVDELDKAFNLLSMRIREWYGLHFPELDKLLDDPYSYVKFVSKVGKRDDMTEEKIRELGIGGGKARAILNAASSSRGADIRDEDMDVLSSLAELALQIRKTREKMVRHIERNMKKIAPNITAIAGPTIGARLLAKAGGLEKLARLPASTIQVLGAEKALFRALKKGTKPPKHGILFQHPWVHGTPRWQRGKIARVIAAKLALAARIDLYRGELVKELAEKLKERIKEIKKKYPRPKKVMKREKRRGKRR